jgi:hypothetical protein
VHIWSARELLNLLLQPSVLARVSGASEDVIEGLLDVIFDQEKDEALGHWIVQAHRFQGAESGANLAAEFQEKWVDGLGPILLVSPTRMLERLNAALMINGHRILTPEGIVAATDRSDLPREVVSVFRAVQSLY